MKKIILALSVLALLGTSPLDVQARHRSHPRTEAQAPAADADNKNDEAAAVDESAVADDDENVAYSDTTSVADDSTFAEDDNQDAADSALPTMQKYNDPVSYTLALLGSGFGGVVIGIIIILFIVVVLFFPFIIILLIIRYLIKRHNDRVMLAEKAMDAGVEIPERLKPVAQQDEEYLWRSGVKKAAIGVGLMVMFIFMDANTLAGVGGLILCLGIGQMVMARTTHKKKENKEEKTEE
jgi:hypothetical protein